MLFFKNKRRPRRRSLNSQVAALESRTLLSGVTSAIQIDQQAPSVMIDSDTFQLLSLADDDSTRIFQSDGTQAGTIQLADILGTVVKTDIFGEVGSRLIFRASQPGQLWATDGTPAGTLSIADLSFDDAFAEAGLFQDRLYFAGDGGNGVELWLTDGTTAGTRQVADINSDEETPVGVSFAFDAIPDAILYDVRLVKYLYDSSGTDTVLRSSPLPMAFRAPP